MKTFIKILAENKYEYVSGSIVIISFLFFKELGFFLACFWVGFWTGVKYIKRRIEKKFETAENEKDFYEKIRNYIYIKEI